MTDWNSSFALMWGAGYGGIPALVLVGLMVGFGPPWNDWILDQRGRSVVATPYAVEDTNVSINGESLKRIRLRFRDARGQEQQASLSTTSDPQLASARSGQPTQIDYDPQDPSLVRSHGHASSLFNAPGMGWLLPMRLFVFILPGLGAFFVGLWRLHRRRQVYRTGTSAPATIFEHTTSASSENDEPLLIARYEFTAGSGRHTGEIKALRPPPVGTRLWIVYDPARPSRNLPA